jgi:hypothetical protein
MARTYTEFKRIIQPLFQRYRNTFRGPRSSAKENLEMNKMLIDLKKLDEKADYLNEKTYSSIQIFVGQVDPEQLQIHDDYEDGKYYRFDDVIFEFFGDGATPDYLEIDTTSTVSSKLSRIAEKVKELENKKV